MRYREFVGYVLFALLLTVWIFVSGCDWMGGEWEDRPTHRAEEAEAYCSTEQILNFGLSGSKSLVSRCDKGIGINESCRRAHYRRCLRSYR